LERPLGAGLCEKNLRRKKARPGDKWHLDEVFTRIKGAIHISGVPWIRRAARWTFSFSRAAIKMNRAGIGGDLFTWEEGGGFEKPSGFEPAFVILFSLR